MFCQTSNFFQEHVGAVSVMLHLGLLLILLEKVGEDEKLVAIFLAS
jgi:hypothetical protein